jgi:hypothetical protein
MDGRFAHFRSAAGNPYLPAGEWPSRRTRTTGARNDQDHQAGLLARLTGFGVVHVQTSIVVLFAALVEFGSAFGLFLALLPMRAFPSLAVNARANHDATEIRAVLAPRPIRRDGSTRFARAADDQLMIE